MGQPRRPTLQVWQTVHLKKIYTRHFEKNSYICSVVSFAITMVELPLGKKNRAGPQFWLEVELVPRGKKNLAMHQTFALDAQRVWVFGSDPQRAHIVLDCPCVDACHAELARVEAEEVDGSTEWELSDYGGDNGTFLNGERVSRARVSRCVRGGALSFSSFFSSLTLHCCASAATTASPLASGRTCGMVAASRLSRSVCPSEA